jgi:hypothetical protein
MIHFATEMYLSEFTSLGALTLNYWSGRSDKACYDPDEIYRGRNFNETRTY